jgi:hypothetical protein
MCMHVTRDSICVLLLLFTQAELGFGMYSAEGKLRGVVDQETFHFQFCRWSIQYNIQKATMLFYTFPV